MSDELELFNLSADIGESRNLAKTNPEKLNELKAAWDAWNSTFAEPRWTKSWGTGTLSRGTLRPMTT